MDSEDVSHTLDQRQAASKTKTQIGNDRSEEIKINLESCTETAKIESEDDKKPALQDLTTPEFARAHECERVTGEIAHLNTPILSLAGQLSTLEKSMGTILQKIDGRETNLEDGHKIMTLDVPSLKQEQDQLEQNVEPSNKDNTDGSHRNKTDVPAASKTETQICNDRTDGPLSSIAISKTSEPTSVDLLLIGKTGVGKSATGNSILGWEAFKSRSGISPVTLNVDYGVSELNGQVIKVVDGPGVGDTRRNTEKAVNLILETMKCAFAANPRGYHAFCLVVRFGQRFTREEKDTFDFFKKVFGQDFVNKFCILVLTCGDNFETESEESGQTFEEWCKEQEGVFKELLNEFDIRIVLFDNRTKDDRKKKEQVAKLLEIVDSLSSHCKRYTDENFQKAKGARDQIIVESLIPMIQEETSLIKMQLQNIRLEADRDNEITLLEQLLIQAKALEKSITSRDHGTGALDELKSTVESIGRSVDGEIKSYYRMKKEQERIRKHEEDTERKYKEEIEKMNQEAITELEKKLKKELEEEQRKQQEEYQNLAELLAKKAVKNSFLPSKLFSWR